MDSIACMTKSPNKRLLAVSERLKNDSLPQVAIYNLRAAPSKIEQEKRVFKYSESKSTYFSAVAFSHQDSRFMVCLTGEPDFQIIFLDIARMKPLAHAVLGTDISRISISPKDNRKERKTIEYIFICMFRYGCCEWEELLQDTEGTREFIHLPSREY